MLASGQGNSVSCLLWRSCSFTPSPRTLSRQLKQTEWQSLYFPPSLPPKRKKSLGLERNPRERISSPSNGADEFARLPTPRALHVSDGPVSRSAQDLAALRVDGCLATGHTISSFATLLFVSGRSLSTTLSGWQGSKRFLHRPDSRARSTW